MIKTSIRIVTEGKLTEKQIFLKLKRLLMENIENKLDFELEVVGEKQTFNYNTKSKEELHYDTKYREKR